ncbi:MAG: helix-turn-helix transcriptional regulator [Pseudomonadota bacterium]
MPRTSKDDDLPVYNRLTVLRAEHGLSRQDLAKAVGVHYQTIGYLERGEYKPSLVLALRVARLFKLPVEAVFSLEPMQPLSVQLYTPPLESSS